MFRTELAPMIGVLEWIISHGCTQWRIGAIAVLLALPPIATADEPAAGPLEPIDASCVFDANDAGLWIDRMHARLTTAACDSAQWFDGFFGTPHDYDAYRGSYGSLSLGTLWDEYGGFDPNVRFKLRLRLPQLNGRLNAFVGRVDEDEFVTGTLDQFDALPDQFRMVDDEALLLGLGYSRPGLRGQIDADAGIHVDIPLDPYVRLNYRRAWGLPIDVVARFRQSLFWREKYGFGTSSKVDLDRELSERVLLRVSAIGKIAERIDGVGWTSTLTLYQELGPKHALAYQLAVQGETGHEVGLLDYGARLIYRRQVWREWLILELRGGIGWPREWLTEKREFNWGLGAAIEMRFGDWPHLRAALAGESP